MEGVINYSNVISINKNKIIKIVCIPLDQLDKNLVSRGNTCDARFIIFGALKNMFCDLQIITRKIKYMLCRL